VRVNVLNRTGKAQDVDVYFFRGVPRSSAGRPKDSCGGRPAKTNEPLKLQAASHWV